LLDYPFDILNYKNQKNCDFAKMSKKVVQETTLLLAKKKLFFCKLTMIKSSGFLRPCDVFYPVVVVQPFVIMDETSPKSSSSIICITLFANTVEYIRYTVNFFKLTVDTFFGKVNSLDSTYVYHRL